MIENQPYIDVCASLIFQTIFCLCRSMQVALCLSRLRRLGITVICVIHQPRYGIFRTFTDVLLLGKGGNTVYQGPTSEIEDYFINKGFKMVAGENVHSKSIHQIM